MIPRIIQLFIISLIITGCQNQPSKNVSREAGTSVTKHATDHVRNINSSISSSQSTVTNLARQMFPPPKN